MKIGKRLLSTFLAVVMVVALIPFYSQEVNAAFKPVFTSADWYNSIGEPHGGYLSSVTENGFTLSSNINAIEAFLSSPNIFVTPGEEYSIELSVAGDDWDVYMMFYNGRGELIGYYDENGNINPEFENMYRFSSAGLGNLSRKFIAPSGSIYATVRCDANGAENTVRFKNINVFETYTASVGTNITAEFASHKYQFFSESLTWTEAKAKCESLGGNLISINTAEENAFVADFLRTKADKKCYWIGTSFDESTQKWINTDGTESLWTNWAANEPNNYKENGEKYAHIYGCQYDGDGTKEIGQWNDATNNGAEYIGTLYELSNFGYICEWEIDDETLEYYTEYWDSSIYNPVLAKITATFSNAVYDKKEIETLYKAHGFEETYFDVYDYSGEFNPYKSGHAIGFKKLENTDSTICMVAVRGSVGKKWESDWLGNYSILTTDDDKHIGFAYPANYIYINIKELIKKYGITGNVKFVITGHSRGGAVANLLSVQLMEHGVDASNIYNYNFACPDVACKVIFPNYSNIFNLCNREDIVPFIPGHLASAFTTPLTSWGKFGKTYWFTKNDPTTIDPSANHSMSLYLDYFSQELDLCEWEHSLEDVLFDLNYLKNGIVTKILCPVDVEITDQDGNVIASVIDGNPIYSDDCIGDVLILTDGDKKVIYTRSDNKINVNLVGTDTGTMTYTVENGNMCTGEIFESKTFSNIELYEGKKMNSPVFKAETVNDIELFVVQNVDGEDFVSHKVNVDGTENEINHIYIRETLNPTCTEKGYTVNTCLGCGDSYNDFYVDEYGHNHSDWIISKDATCITNGLKYIECTVCGMVQQTEEILATGHAESEWIIDTIATCIKGGAKHIECVVCEEVIATELISATGHIDKDNNGVCDNCSIAFSDEVEKPEDTHCNHICHSNNSFMKFIWQIFNFIMRILSMEKYCVCGVAHY